MSNYIEDDNRAKWASKYSGSSDFPELSEQFERGDIRIFVDAGGRLVIRFTNTKIMPANEALLRMLIPLFGNHDAMKIEYRVWGLQGLEIVAT